MSAVPAVFAVPSITRDDILERARSVIGTGTYSWGRGGFDPNADSPYSGEERWCDCSGFLAWCIREPRENPGIAGGWIQMTAILQDAIGPQDAAGLQRMFIRPSAPALGDIIVYSEQHVMRGTPKAFVRPGHGGIVSEITGGHPSKAIHCAKGNMKTFEYAIAETNVRGFLACNAIVIRPRKVSG